MLQTMAYGGSLGTELFQNVRSDSPHLSTMSVLTADRRSLLRPIFRCNSSEQRTSLNAHKQLTTT